MAQVRVHLVDGDNFVLEYVDTGSLPNIPREAWHEFGIDIIEDDIEFLEPLG